MNLFQKNVKADLVMSLVCLGVRFNANRISVLTGSCQVFIYMANPVTIIITKYKMFRKLL